MKIKGKKSAKIRVIGNLHPDLKVATEDGDLSTRGVIRGAKLIDMRIENADLHACKLKRCVLVASRATNSRLTDCEVVLYPTPVTELQNCKVRSTPKQRRLRGFFWVLYLAAMLVGAWWIWS